MILYFFSQYLERYAIERYSPIQCIRIVFEAITGHCNGKSLNCVAQCSAVQTLALQIQSTLWSERQCFINSFGYVFWLYEFQLARISFHVSSIFHHQRNYTTHPMRVTKTFYAEFSNWNAVYEAVEMRLHNVDFIEEIFALLIRVINHIKMNKVNVENSLRAFSHKSIEFAQNLDRSHVIVYANIIHALLHADRQLQLIDDVSFYRISLLHFRCDAQKKVFFFGLLTDTSWCAQRFLIRNRNRLLSRHIYSPVECDLHGSDSASDGSLAATIWGMYKRIQRISTSAEHRLWQRCRCDGNIHEAWRLRMV